MLSAYVCRPCSLRLARRTAAARCPQWQPRLTFLSLRGRPDTHIDTSKPADSAATAEEVLDDGQQRAFDGLPSSHTSWSAGPTSRYAQFVDHDEPQPAPDDGLASLPSYTQPLVCALERKDHKNFPVAWKAFVQIFTSRDCKALTEPSPTDIEALRDGKLFLNLLHTGNSYFCRGYSIQTVTPTQVLFRYEQLGISHPDYWTDTTLRYLTYQVIHLVYSPYPNPQNVASLLEELLSLWRLLFQCKGIHGDELHSISTEWQLPALDSQIQRFATRNFGYRLQEYIPKIPNNQSLTFCVAYFYHICHTQKVEDSFRQKAAPLLRFLEQLLASSYIDLEDFSQMLSLHGNLSRDVQGRVRESIGRTPRQAMARLGLRKTPGESGPMSVGGKGTTATTVESRGVSLEAASGGDTAASSGNVPEGENEIDDAAKLEEFYIKRISRAVEAKKSLPSLQGLWVELKDIYTSNESGTTIPPRIYDALLLGFLVLLDPQHSVHVWNHMIARGVQPTLRTWSAMLTGCARAKDLLGLDAMWQRMLNTGCEPDKFSWTARVHGLISLRQVDRGIAALDEMGKKWLLGENMLKTNKSTKTPKNSKGINRGNQVKAVNEFAKPTIDVANGGITAVIQNRYIRQDKKIELVQKILGWANSFGLQPDAHTYNSLINLYLSAGDHAMAFKILRQMEAKDIASDPATYSMLISFAFENGTFDNFSHAEQITRVLSLLDSIEVAGVKLNAYIYTTAIDRLLKRYSNIDAVRIIFDHMQARNISKTAAIYTTVMTYYFQTEPPNISGVDNIVHQIFSSHHADFDRILFDRLIEGYAKYGEVDSMMNVLTRMAKHRMQPSWTALRFIIQAFVKEGDIFRAKDMVNDAALLRGVAMRGVTGGGNAQKEFFSTARGLGLVPKEYSETGRYTPTDAKDGFARI